MEQESVNTSSSSVKEEPPEEFVLDLPAEDYSPEPEDEVEPGWTKADVKEEPPEDYVLTLPPETNENTHKCDKCPHDSRIESELTTHGDPSSFEHLQNEFTTVQDQKLHELFHMHHIKTKWNSPAECPHCHRIYNNKANLIRHLRICSKSNPARVGTCPHCQQMVKLRSNLTKHLAACPILNPARLHCDICGERFQKRWALKSHMLRHSDERKFRCLKCGFGFKKNAELLKHLRSKRILSCSICEMKFSCRNLFHRHRRESHGFVFKRDVYKCDKCPYQSTQWGVFRKHKGVHDKSFSCETCQKTFAIDQSLVLHQMEHRHGIYATAPEQTFNCDICDKSFSNPSYLKKHQTRVHDENDIKCDVCGKICKNRYLLLSHQRSHAKVECSICKKMISSYAKPAHLRLHQTRSKLIKDDRSTKGKRKLKKRRNGLDKTTKLRKKSRKSHCKNLSSIEVKKESPKEFGDASQASQPEDFVKIKSETKEEPQMEHFLVLKPKWVKSAKLVKFDGKWTFKSTLFQKFSTCPHCQLVVEFQREVAQHWETCSRSDLNAAVDQEGWNIDATRTASSSSIHKFLA